MSASKFICKLCGRDCRTALALSKHEPKCEGEFKFSNRHETKMSEKCPICLDGLKDFWKKEEDTWVCLTCGCHFSPKRLIDRINQGRIRAVSPLQAVPRIQA